MVELGVATIRFRYPEVSDLRLKELGLGFFDLAEGAARDLIRLEDSYVLVELQEGTLKVRNRFFAAALAVGVFVSNYGSVRQGVFDIAHDVYTAGKFIIEHIPERAGVRSSDIITTRRSATLARRVQKILRSVETGEIGADEALHRLAKLFEADSSDAVDRRLIEALKKELERARPRSKPASSTQRIIQEQIPLIVREECEPLNTPEPYHELPLDRPRRRRKLRVEREGAGGPVRVIIE